MWTEHEILDSTEHKAIVDSIEHWERMIAWAEEQVCLWAVIESHGPYRLNCDDPISANTWSDVNKARSWGEWLVHARRVLAQLESLLPGKEDT